MVALRIHCRWNVGRNRPLCLVCFYLSLLDRHRVVTRPNDYCWTMFFGDCSFGALRQFRTIFFFYIFLGGLFCLDSVHLPTGESNCYFRPHLKFFYVSRVETVTVVSFFPLTLPRSTRLSKTTKIQYDFRPSTLTHSPRAGSRENRTATVPMYTVHTWHRARSWHRAEPDDPSLKPLRRRTALASTERPSTTPTFTAATF